MTELLDSQKPVVRKALEAIHAEEDAIAIIMKVADPNKLRAHIEEVRDFALDVYGCTEDEVLALTKAIDILKGEYAQ